MNEAIVLKKEIADEELFTRGYFSNLSWIMLSSKKERNRTHWLSEKAGNKRFFRHYSS